MRYAIVTDTYTPDINGVALTLQSYAAGLRARGHTVEVVRPVLPGEAAAGDDGLRVRGLRLPRYPSLRVGLPAQARLHAAWRAERPDAVYVATETPLGGSAIRAARALGIPVVTALHTRFDLYMADYGLRALGPLALAWMRRFHGGADATVVATRALAAWLQAQRIGHAVVLPRAVDCVQFDPARRDAALRTAWDVPADGLAVIHVGRLAAEKNLPLALRAFRALQRRRPDARLVFVGDGPLRPALQRAHPDIVFAGARRGDDLGRHFASADLFLFPSRSETFGNVVLEAMASGVPQVAFDLGAASEHLLDGHHGARIADDADGGAAFVAAAVRLACDDAGRSAMAQAGREAMLRLTPDQVAAELDALLAAPAARSASLAVPQESRHARNAA
ncbi:glycosyltransferase family 1 protein [Luteimonas sp. FCS-9]|uniref:glycosyltransferase family 4 protein n=1 Tax=Luteimonas sp. FCS-9 TaxID=1547516 RepID=UPI00063ED07B|nr:glycosyltransferase family 1 protein [Luteimonas sp. FCS-9]KLI98383.1 glycosyl transferase [Luteimonas sp. FCS-9]